MNNKDSLTSLECRYALGKIPWGTTWHTKWLCNLTYYRSLRRLVLCFPPKKPPNKRLLRLLARHSQQLTHLEIWSVNHRLPFVKIDGKFPNLRHLTVPSGMVFDCECNHPPLAAVVPQLQSLKKLSSSDVTYLAKRRVKP